MSALNLLRKLLGAFRLFRRNFNRNGPNSIRHTRSQLYPYAHAAAAVIGLLVFVANPLLVGPYAVTVYVALFMDADSGDLAATALGSVGEGLATLLLNLFTLVGALMSAGRWLRSQL